MRVLISLIAGAALFCAAAIADVKPFKPTPGTFKRFAAAYIDVERRGELASVQDELVWYFGLVAEDAMARGSARWNQGGEGMITRVQEILCDRDRDCAQIRADVETVRRFARADPGSEGEIQFAVSRLMDSVLQWIDAHPVPIRFSSPFKIQ